MHIHFLFVAANIQLLCLHWENLKWRKWSTAGKRLFRTWHSVLAVGCGFILSLSTQSPCGVSCSEYEFIDILNIMATASHFRFLQAVEVIVMWIVIYIYFIYGIVIWNNSYMEILLNSLLFWKFLNYSYFKILGNYFIWDRKKCPGFRISQTAGQTLVCLLTSWPPASSWAFLTCRLPVSHKRNRVICLRRLWELNEVMSHWA